MSRSVEPGTGTIRLSLALGEWAVSARAYTPEDILAGIGSVTVTVPVSAVVLIPMNTSAEVSAKAITAFSVTGPVTAEGTIDEGAKTVTINVPYGTDVIGMITAITHTGASVSPAPGTAVDFSAPQTFTVTAADGTTQPYTVTVNAAPFIPVTNITGVPAAATAGTGLTLTGTWFHPMPRTRPSAGRSKQRELPERQ
jgi:hypothetical protein